MSGIVKKVNLMDVDESRLEKDLEGWEFPSLDFAYDEARRIIDGQLAAVDGLDTKASILAGFSGIILTSLFTVLPALLQRSDPVARIPIALACLAVLFAGFAALKAYWVMDYRNVPSIEQLKNKYIKWKERNTKYSFLFRLAEAYEINERLTTEKSKWIKGSIFLLLCSFVLAALGFIYLLLT